MVFSSDKLRLRLWQEFSVDETLVLFLQIYNLQPDDAIPKSSYWSSTEDSDSTRQTGEQITLDRLVPLSAFPPGNYILEVAVRDRVSGQTLDRHARFALKRLNPATH